MLYFSMSKAVFFSTYVTQFSEPMLTVIILVNVMNTKAEEERPFRDDSFSIFLGNLVVGV